MTEESLFPNALLDVMRRFEQCKLPEIQAAFAAAAAGTAAGEKDVLWKYISDIAVNAKLGNDPDALGNLAAVFAGSSHFDVAIPLLEKACNTDTDHSLPRRLMNGSNLGLCYLRNGHHRDALAAYERVIEIWKKELEARELADYIEHHIRNFELYAEIIFGVRVGISDAAQKIGLELRAEGKEEEARPYLEKAAQYRLYLEGAPTEVPTGQRPTLH